MAFRFVSVYARVLLVGFVLTAEVSPAAAQSPPDGLEPHGFVEPCTVGNVQEMYTECELCEVRQGDTQVCTDKFGKRGYEKKCQTHGAHGTWGEVWCIDTRRSPEKVAPATPAAPSKLPFIVGAPVLLGVLLVLRRAWLRRNSSSKRG